MNEDIEQQEKLTPEEKLFELKQNIAEVYATKMAKKLLQWDKDNWNEDVINELWDNIKDEASDLIWVEDTLKNFILWFVEPRDWVWEKLKTWTKNIFKKTFFSFFKKKLWIKTTLDFAWFNAFRKELEAANLQELEETKTRNDITEEDLSILQTSIENWDTDTENT